MISSRRGLASYYKPHIFMMDSVYHCGGQTYRTGYILGRGHSAEEAYTNWLVQLPRMECEYHTEYINRGK